MPEVKLVYFDLKARGEPARLLLAYAGVKYEDHRIPAPFVEPGPWQALKPTTPFGQVPVLYWNGESIAQSMAIARFLAREFGLAGRNNLESGQVDEIVDALQDIANDMKWFFEKDPTKKAELKKVFYEKTVATTLANVEKRLVARGGQFLVGNAFSWADLHLFNICSMLEPSAISCHPKISNLVSRVGNMPNIKHWVETRPASII